MTFVVFYCSIISLVQPFSKCISSSYRRHSGQFLVMKRNGPNRKSSQREADAQPNYEIIEDDRFSYNGGIARYVKPYIQEFVTFAKGRWLGREVMEILSTEFGGQSTEYWAHAIQQGHVRINDRNVVPSYTIRNGDRLLHRTHRYFPIYFPRRICTK
jgi:hypothetical protein